MKATILKKDTQIIMLESAVDSAFSIAALHKEAYGLCEDQLYAYDAKEQEYKRIIQNKNRGIWVGAAGGTIGGILLTALIVSVTK